MIEIIHYIQNNYLDLAGTLIGLLYLYLEFTAKKSMWIISIIMATLYIYIFFNSELYAMSIIYVYFFVASIIGWFKWQQYSKIIILRMPPFKILQVSLFVFLSCAIIYLLLKIFTATNNEIMMGDAIATALSVVAIWMAGKRWAEQWCLLIPANFLTALLLFMHADYASASLFFIYFIVSIFGLRHWVKLANAAR